jgi:hypothetical protein
MMRGNPKSEGGPWFGAVWLGFSRCLFHGFGLLTQRRKDAKTQRGKRLWEVKFESLKHVNRCHHFLGLFVWILEQKKIISLFKNYGITSQKCSSPLRLCVFESLRLLTKTLICSVAHRLNSKLQPDRASDFGIRYSDLPPSLL